MIMEFCERIWDVIKSVPKGKVTTYMIIANHIGSKAYRAVGNACNRNRSSDVPCHRVVRSDGKLGGFNRGSLLKAKILRSEGIDIKNGKINNLDNVMFKFGR